MPGDCCHGDIAAAPGLTKVKIEGVVLYVLVAGVVLAHTCQSSISLQA